MISFVCGQLCSGKTLYSKALAHICNGTFIEVGDIVRSIKSTEDRKSLQNSKNLFETIIKEIKNKVQHEFKHDLVISGVRQKEILQAFENATLLWVECPKEVRQQRYINRSREGDTQTFEEAEEGDINLGILEVKQYILNKNNI